MKNVLAIIVFTLFFLSSSGQTDQRKYLYHGHNFNDTYSYYVGEIKINSDSTYIWKSFNVSNKREWKNYKQITPIIKTGKITKKGKFYLLTQYINGKKTDFHWTTKISNKRLRIFYLGMKNKLKKGVRYKRI